jgi:glycosyltransferase involved in cell wall biosynthesis
MEIEGILMRGRFAYPAQRPRDRIFARAWLAATTRSPFDILHHLDPIPYEAIMARGGRLAARSRLIPEPVEPVQQVDRVDARRRLCLPEDGRLICCPGWLDTRKGVDRLIRAFAAAQLAGTDRLLLAGRMEPAIRSVLDAHAELQRAGRLIAREGCLSDEELHLSMSAADLVCTPYPRHIGSSGIIVRAAALQRMVLASDFGWVGMIVARFGLGMTCDCRDDDALASALPAALARSSAFRPTDAAARFTQFHTHENFAAHISARLRQRVGTAPSTALRTWDSVIRA